MIVPRQQVLLPQCTQITPRHDCIRTARLSCYHNAHKSPLGMIVPRQQVLLPQCTQITPRQVSCYHKAHRSPPRYDCTWTARVVLYLFQTISVIHTNRPPPPPSLPTPSVKSHQYWAERSCQSPSWAASSAPPPHSTCTLCGSCPGCSSCSHAAGRAGCERWWRPAAWCAAPACVSCPGSRCGQTQTRTAGRWSPSPGFQSAKQSQSLNASQKQMQNQQQKTLNTVSPLSRFTCWQCCLHKF